MRTRSLWFCAIAPAAAQFGFSFSLPPALASITSALHSLADPGPFESATHAPAPRPIAQTTRTPQPSAEETTVAPPVRTTSVRTTSARPTTLVTSSISHPSQTTQRTQRTGHAPLIHTTSATLHRPSKLAETAARAPSTHTATSDGSGGLSQGAKVGIGVGIGVLVLLALLAGALYSFVRDRHTSEAYSNWRERRRNKHERLGSSATNTSFRDPTLPTITPKRKETELGQAHEYGNGTLFGRPFALEREKSVNYSDYDHGRILGPLAVVNQSTPDAEKEVEMPSPLDSSQTLDGELPPPPMVYQQARQIYIKRKAVPGQAPLQSAPAAQNHPPLTGHQESRTRFSWMN